MTEIDPPAANRFSPITRGRICVLLAAVLWSSSGLFVKAPLFADWPLEARGMLLAFWRALFAGLILLPAVRRPRFRPTLIPMVVCFVAMSATYLSAMTQTTAANAIWLQSTAPFWIFLLSLTLGIERVERTNFVPLALAAVGVGTILFFEIQGQSRLGIVCGLLAGMAYAGVVVFMRALRGEDSAWLVAVNHVAAAAILLPYVIYVGHWPDWQQAGLLVAFGCFQMGLPYLLLARGLRSVSLQEATAIGLVEPLLLPVWVLLAYGERPAVWTLAGGAFILAGLLLRYGGALVRLGSGRAAAPIVLQEHDRREAEYRDG